MNTQNPEFPNTDENDRGFVIALDRARALLDGEGGMSFAVVAGREQPPMTAMLYAPKGFDDQKPHDRDEIYVIVSGHGMFEYDGRSAPFKTGDIIYVAAHTVHKFAGFSDDFCTWVFFYGDKVPRKGGIRTAE